MSSPLEKSQMGYNIVNIILTTITIFFGAGTVWYTRRTIIATKKKKDNVRSELNQHVVRLNENIARIEAEIQELRELAKDMGARLRDLEIYTRATTNELNERSKNDLLAAEAEFKKIKQTSSQRIEDVERDRGQILQNALETFTHDSEEGD